MCILFLHVANRIRPGAYQVILANNRDEYYIRPTKPAARWTDNQHCISGLDLEPGREGGTWLGLNEQGKIGILLNLLQSCEPSKDKKGRGSLVTDFLRNSKSAEEYTTPLAADRHLYNPFHLILMEKRLKTWDIHYFGSDEDSSPCTLEPGVTGWGNCSRAETWNKVEIGKTKFSDVVQKYDSVTDRDVLVDNLWTLLNDTEKHFPDAVLEAKAKGYLTDEVTQERSAIHVLSKSISYGTRTNTLLLIDSEGHGEYIERTMRQPIDPDNPIWDTTCIQLNMQHLHVAS